MAVLLVTVSVFFTIELIVIGHERRASDTWSFRKGIWEDWLTSLQPSQTVLLILVERIRNCRISSPSAKQSPTLPSHELLTTEKNGG